MKLMDYSGENPPFKVGDVVECICDEKPEFYYENWTIKDGIHVGDRLVISNIDQGWAWHWMVGLDGKRYDHSARLFKLVEPEAATPSSGLEAALKFLETSGDVLQALKIAAGVQ